MEKTTFTSPRKRVRAAKDPNAKPKNKLYFTKATQAAIVRFQNALTTQEKEQIYKTEINPALEKLSENLIRVYGFIEQNASYEELKADCIAHLYEKLGKFKSEMGTNAFSYFNIVGKNFLMFKCKTSSELSKRSLSFDNYNSFTPQEKEAVEYYSVANAQDEIYETKLIPYELLRMLESLRLRIKNKNEMLCVESIIILFENAHHLDNLTKKGIFVYLRELSGLKSKQIITVLSRLKKHYKELKGLDEFGFMGGNSG